MIRIPDLDMKQIEDHLFNISKKQHFRTYGLIKSAENLTDVCKLEGIYYAR